MSKIIRKIKDILGITRMRRDIQLCINQFKVYNQQVEFYRKDLKIFKDELKEFARMDADVGFRGNNTIILTGVYRNRAYVQFYDVGDGEFRHLVEEMRDRHKHFLIRHVDQPMHFHGGFDVKREAMM